MSQEVVYTNPSTIKGAGAQLNNQPLIDTGTKDEKFVVTRAKALLELMRADRKQYDGNWETDRKYYGGDHWFNKLRPAHRAKPAPNYIFADIETLIPIMTDHTPDINILADEQKDARRADDMQASVRETFRRNKMQTKSVYILKNAHIYGTGIAKVWYNPKTKRIEINSIDTRRFFIAPGATEIQRSAYCGIALNRFVSDCERDFPHLKGKIQGGVIDESFTHKPVDPDKLYEQDRSTVVNNADGSLVGAQDGDGGDSTRKIVTQIELWERDPQGQVWVTVICGDTLARRSKSPYKNGRPDYPGGSKYPFAADLCYPIDSQFWGMGEVANLKNPQDMVNRSEAQIADLGRLCTSPYMRLHRNSRVSLKDITNRIASFIVWDGEIPPDWMPPPGVAGELFRIVENAKAHMDNMSSVHEASRGELPSDRISGVAIQRLQKATTGRVALKTRMYEEFIVEVAELVIDLTNQYYTNRTVRSGHEYRTINPTETRQDGSQAVIPAKDLSLATYQVEIGVGSTLPVDKGVRAEQALELYKAGALARRTTLKRQGWTEEQVDEAEEEYKQEKLADADMEIKIQALSAATMAAAAPPEPAAAGGGESPSPAAAPEAVGAAAPAPGGDDVSQIEQELSQLEAG